MREYSLVSVSGFGAIDAVKPILDSFVVDGTFRVDSEYFKIAFERAELQLPISGENAVHLVIVVTEADIAFLTSEAFLRAVTIEVMHDALVKIRDLYAGDYFSVHWFSPSKILLIGAIAKRCFSNDTYVESYANCLAA